MLESVPFDFEDILQKIPNKFLNEVMLKNTHKLSFRNHTEEVGLFHKAFFHLIYSKMSHLEDLTKSTKIIRIILTT